LLKSYQPADAAKILKHLPKERVAEILDAIFLIDAQKRREFEIAYSALLSQ
jgi:hypothetical protein